MRNWKELFRIDHQAKVPLYHQITENFMGLIRSGQLQPGEAVPSEWEISELYGVSRLTVRRALDELVREGLVTRRHGVGTFVSNPTEAQIVPSVLSFTKNMQIIGRVPGSKVVRVHAIPASAEIAQALGLEVGAPVIELVRVRLADDKPLILETTYLSQEHFSDVLNADLTSDSLYSFISERYQVNIVALDQSMEPTLLTDWEAKLLNVKLGSPAILSELIGFTAEGKPVEYTWSVTCGGRGRFYFHFREGDIGKRHFTTNPASNIKRK